MVRLVVLLLVVGGIFSGATSSSKTFVSTANAVASSSVEAAAGSTVQRAAESDLTCQNAVFTYLAVSGSIYDTDYFPKVQYGGREMFVMDAMLQFLGQTYAEAGALQTGDRFELYGFADGTISLLEPVLSYDFTEDASAISRLHARLDEDRDGTVGWRELGVSKAYIQTTDCGSLLQHIRNRVGTYLASGTERAATVVVFTDGECETEPGELQRWVRQFSSEFSTAIRTRAMRILLFPYDEGSDLARTVASENAGVSINRFPLGEQADIDAVARETRTQIRKAVRRGVFISKEDVKVVPASTEGVERFLIPVRNRSCAEEQVREVGYEIENGERERVSLQTVAVSRTIPPMQSADTIGVDIATGDLLPGTYRMEFFLGSDDIRTATRTITYEKEPPISRRTIGIVFLVLIGLAGYMANKFMFA